jgi:hypothetical protein
LLGSAFFGTENPLPNLASSWNVASTQVGGVLSNHSMVVL